LVASLPSQLQTQLTNLPLSKQGYPLHLFHPVIRYRPNFQDDSGSRSVAQAAAAKEFTVADCPTCSKATLKGEFQLFANSIGVGSASAFLGAAPPTMKWAVIDYAIHSDESPTGWVGTQFNDYFEASITCGPKSLPGAPLPPFVATSGSIGQLSFDPQGTTNCQRLSINLQALKSKSCVVGVSVADAIDKLLHTSICAKAYYSA